MNNFFKIYGNCFIVKGFSESLLYDLENGSYYPIPNDIADILLEIEENNIQVNKLNDEYGEKSKDIKKILDYFVENNLAHYVSNPDSFPKINLDWKSPYKIENAIIEFDNTNSFDVVDVLKQLEILGCQAIEFRFIDKFNLNYLSEILDVFTESSFKYYSIATKYNKNISIEEYKKFAFKYRRISHLLVFVKNQNDTYKKLKESMRSKPKVIYLDKDLKPNMDEQISTNTLIINIPSFVEAQKYNIGLNRKVCINKNGLIKNFLTHQKDFGSIRTIKIEEVIKTKEFTKKWFLSNDKIEICKDCQYRYMCLSNSDIIEKNGKYYKKNYCSFDPIKNIWEKGNQNLN